MAAPSFRGPTPGELAAQEWTRPDAVPEAPLGDGDLPALAPYRKSEWRRSLIQLAVTLSGFLLLWALAWWCLEISYFLTLAVAIPAAGFLVRLFILAHDCGHGSFFPSRRANEIVGCALGLLTLTPYHRWRKHHAIHHATTGNLDRRGSGDVHLLTVDEYTRLSPFQRWLYRLHRHPLVLFGIGPFLYFVVWQRLPMEPRSWKKERRSVQLTNLALLACGGLVASQLGLVPFLAVHLPIVALASSAGVWLFYIQHHFPSTYWRRSGQWNYTAASLEGSSYYQLPWILQWLTAHIGIHHIHHLDSRIPNYNLQACFDENPTLQQAYRVTLRDSLASIRLALWDEQTCQLVPFPKRVNASSSTSAASKDIGER